MTESDETNSSDTSLDDIQISHHRFKAEAAAQKLLQQLGVSGDSLIGFWTLVSESTPCRSELPKLSRLQPGGLDT